MFQHNKKTSRDHTSLICDISELSGLFTDATSLENFLQKIVEVIAEHMNSEVCSIYIYYDDTQELVLKATKGLNKDLIGKVKLQKGQGLTGLAVKEQRAICERHASKNQNFYYFSGLGEEEFESFLAVPIIRGITVIGAIVVQNKQRHYFQEADVRALRAITTQLANTIEAARFLITLEEEHVVKKNVLDVKDLSFIKGKMGAPGVAFTEAIVLDNYLDWQPLLLLGNKKQYTLEELHEAFRVTQRQLENYQQQIEKKLSDVASLIFSAQILMLKDQHFIHSIEKLIHEQINPPEAIARVAEGYLRKLDNISNSYLREKGQDVKDVVKRLLENLIRVDHEFLEVDGRIVIAEELFPTDALKLSSQNVKGIILLSGGQTSHFAILCQSLAMPLIIADVPELMGLPQKTKVMIDTEPGNIFIDPDKKIIASFHERIKAMQDIHKVQETISTQSHTADGNRVILMATINLLSDVPIACSYKAEGIGLYRTEFPFVVRNNFPGEEEQYVIYKKLIDDMPGEEVTFRTLDIGGDKVLSYFEDHHKEKNPYMGMRSIRFSLKHVDIFSQQIRAILRASAQAKVRILFPMISSVDEFLQAKEVVTSCIKAMKKERVPSHPHPEIGLMVELPAVMEVINELAEVTDFFSIGTNDFIQYMLAVDRTNEKVADIFLPQHPAVLRAFKKIVDAAIKYKKDVSVCGNMAHDICFTEFFLGIGVRKFSLDAIYIPRIQTAIKSIKLSHAEKFAEKILKKSRLSDISKMMSLD